MDKLKVLQKAAQGGGVLTAITASLCCIGPLVAVALGASGFAASALFEELRPVFLGVTFVLLTLAWYLAYRKPKAACEEGSTCAAKPGSQWNKAILWVSTAFVLIAAAFPTLSSTILRARQDASCCAPAPVADASSAILRLSIPDMNCAACALNIQAVLKSQDGVSQAQVSFDTKAALVRYDTTKLSPEKIIAVIDQTGFKAKARTRNEQP
jgi:copper chaperone CopZ